MRDGDKDDTGDDGRPHTASEGREHTARQLGEQNVVQRVGETSAADGIERGQGVTAALQGSKAEAHRRAEDHPISKGKRSDAHATATIRTAFMNSSIRPTLKLDTVPKPTR